MALGKLNVSGSLEYISDSEKVRIEDEISAVESFIMYDLAISVGNTACPLPHRAPSESVALSKKYGVYL